MSRPIGDRYQSIPHATPHQISFYIAHSDRILPQQFEATVNNLRTLHLSRLTSYRRLLERAQASSAAQAYALQAELSILKERLQSGNYTRSEQDLGEICLCGGRKVKGYWGGYDGDLADEDGIGLAGALKGDGKGVFDEKEVKKAVRKLGREARMRL